MVITFKDRKLKKCVGDPKKMVAAYGTIRADKILQRLDDMTAATNLEDCKDLPGHFEELKFDRKGQWSCRLDEPYRLIFVPHEDPIPTDPSGNYLWIEIVGVEIVEIVNYHKER